MRFKLEIGGMAMLISAWSLVLFLPDHLWSNLSYFHIKYASLIASGDHQPFVWLPHSVHDGRFIDHHYLWHRLFSMPYLFGESIQLAKAFHVLSVSAYFLLLWRISVSEKWIKPVLVFLLLFMAVSLFVSPLSLFRLSMIRVQTISLLFLIGSLYSYHKGRYWITAFLSFFYPWLYLGFVLNVIAIAVYSLFAKGEIGRRAAKFALYVVLPSVLGFVTHPLFPDIGIFAFQYAAIELFGAGFHKDNMEYQPIPLLELLQFSPIVILGFIMAAYSLIKQSGQCDPFYKTIQLFVIV